MLVVKFDCGTAAAAAAACRYPSVILPGLLYLGDWGHAEHEERLKEIGIRRYTRVTQTKQMCGAS
jgi:hypothetical protein